MSFTPPAALDHALERLASAPLLLIACDYDGTLAPIVDDPELARPNARSIAALARLAMLDRTHASVISGRSRAALRSLMGSPQRVHLIGSHGAEFDDSFAQGLPEQARSLLGQLGERLEALAVGTPGATVEYKPSSVALHVRRADADKGNAALEKARDSLGRLDGVHIKHGKKVIEFSITEGNKGHALEYIRHRTGAAAALFIGDDVTDEDAFGVLREPDLGIKVGPEPTSAALRVRDTDDVARVLEEMVTLREAWLAEHSPIPIDHHTMLSDQRTVALVDSRASVAWLCLPKLDSPAVFAQLLGDANAGRFAITDAHGNPPLSQHYVGNSLSLRSEWNGFRLTDFLDCSSSIGSISSGPISLVRQIEGTGRARIEFAPRLDFGRLPTRLDIDGDLLHIRGGIDELTLIAPGVQWTIEQRGQHQTATAEVELEGQRLTLELRTGAAPGAESPSKADRLESTLSFWDGWASRLRLPSRRTELLRRSAIVLRGLVHAPSGAIAAAGTTSLPEYPGGERNWDYRYCWPRDAAMTATTLARIGSTQEALRLLDWLWGVVEHAGGAERLAPIYAIDGGYLPPESSIESLRGYMDSRPVRIGNAADRQVQLDVFGPVVEMVWALCEAGERISDRHLELVNAMADAVLRRWTEPDNGIWEIRGPRQHHVHSKAMCWVTLDRAAKLNERCLGQVREEYRSTSDLIRADVLRHGWNDRVGAYTAAYGHDALDAASLTLGLCGMLPPRDERFARTVEAIERALRSGPTVYRYRYDDGLAGDEGGFHICATWLVEAYALVGRREEALELFDAVADLAGPTGLLSEQHDPVFGRAMGNHPQAYSHLGLIEAALRLEHC